MYKTTLAIVFCEDYYCLSKYNMLKKILFKLNYITFVFATQFSFMLRLNVHSMLCVESAHAITSCCSNGYLIKLKS